MLLFPASNQEAQLHSVMHLHDKEYLKQRNHHWRKWISEEYLKSATRGRWNALASLIGAVMDPSLNTVKNVNQSCNSRLIQLKIFSSDQLIIYSIKKSSEKKCSSHLLCEWFLHVASLNQAINKIQKTLHLKKSSKSWHGIFLTSLHFSSTVWSNQS